MISDSIEIGEFGVAHVWFQCYEKGYSKNAQNTTLDTNSDPNPTHINFVRKKIETPLPHELITI